MNAEQKAAIAKRDAAVAEREKYQAEIDALDLRIEALKNQRDTLVETYWRPAMKAAAEAEWEIKAAKPLTEAQKILLALVKIEIEAGYLFDFKVSRCIVYAPITFMYNRTIAGRDFISFKALISQGWLTRGLTGGKYGIVLTEKAKQWPA